MTSRRVSGGGFLAISLLSWISACGSSSTNLFEVGSSAGQPGTLPQADAGTGAAAGSIGHRGSAGSAGSGTTTGVAGSVLEAGSADVLPSSGAGGAEAGSTNAGAANAGQGGHVDAAGGPSGGAASGTGGAGSGGVANAGAGGLSGSAGNNGTAGAGGAPPKPIGAKCSQDTECALGFCTDGVCCESSCRTACKQCSPAGKCNAVPIDDDACGIIACPADTACRDYPPSITSNRCASFGVCKTKTACTFAAKAPRTPCSTTGPELCDTSANCVSPSVNCGGTTCPVNNSVCCGSSPATFSCVPKGNGSECLSTAGAGPITCDEHADCPIGQLCCISAGAVGFKYACAATAACPASSDLAHSYPICKSFSINPAAPCATGTSCLEGSTDSPSAFEVCK